MTPVAVTRRWHWVLVKPPFGLATADVYRGVNVPEVSLDDSAFRRAWADGDVRRLGRLLHNRLQEPAERLRPELRSMVTRLAAAEPAGLLVSGSGSSDVRPGPRLRDARRIGAPSGPARPSGMGPRTVVVRSLV